MKFIAFNGSPAGLNSATNRMLTAFLRDAAQVGAEPIYYQLCDYQIHHCKGCFSCWFQSPGKCVLQDDMEPLLSALKKVCPCPSLHIHIAGGGGTWTRLQFLFMWC